MTRNEAVYEIDRRVRGAPDPCLDSHFEYGTRAATGASCELLDERGAHRRRQQPAGGRSSARPGWRATRWRAATRCRPWLALGAPCRYGRRRPNAQRSPRPSLRSERPRPRPVGWHTRRRPRSTRAGCWWSMAAFSTTATPTTTTCRTSSTSAARRHLVLPYAFDTNDMQFQHTPRFDTGARDSPTT